MSDDRRTPRAKRLATLRADRVLARDHERLRRETITALRAKLRRTGVQLDDADLEPAYNLAWHAVHAKLAAGETIDNVQGFLVQAAFFRTMDDYRTRHVDRHADLADLERTTGVEDDLAERLDDAQSLRTFSQGLRLRLGARECRAAVLCYLHGYTRPEAAEVLGVTPARMEKIMDGVSKVVRDLVREAQAGEACESRRSLITAYAVGMLDPDGPRHALAAEHLDGCPGCRALVRRLRGLGALVPPVALPWAAVGVDGLHLPAAVLGGGPVPATPPSGATAVPRPGRRPRGSQAVVAGVAAVVTVVAVAGVLAVTRDAPSRAGSPPPAAAGGAGTGDPVALAAAAVRAAGRDAQTTARAAADRRAALEAAERERRQRARVRAARRRAAERRAELANAAAPVERVVPASAPEAAVPEPVVPAQPTPVVPSPSTTPDAGTRTTPSAPERRTTDAGQEFGLEP